MWEFKTGEQHSSPCCWLEEMKSSGKALESWIACGAGCTCGVCLLSHTSLGVWITARILLRHVANVSLLLLFSLFSCTGKAPSLCVEPLCFLPRVRFVLKSSQNPAFCPSSLVLQLLDRQGRRYSVEGSVGCGSYRNERC